MKTIYNEQNGLYYRQVGDCFIPNIILSEEEKQSTGGWGIAHKEYIMRYKKVQFNLLLTSGKLTDCLVEINKQAEELFERLVENMVKSEGITEELKAENQMEWVCRMNNIRSRATKIVNAELIYA